MSALAQPLPQTRKLVSKRLKVSPSSLVDLGVEPPIKTQGDQRAAPGRRHVSLRWLCGTTLTGFAGAALIGAAIAAAFNGRGSVAEAPELAVVKTDGTGQLVNPSTGDRLAKPLDLVSAKHVFRAPTTVSVGPKQVVRVRQFTRVETPLALSTLGLADQVPPFNPLRLMADAGAGAAPPPDPGPAPDDAEVSYEVRDLSDVSLSRLALTLAQAQVQAADYLRRAIAGQAIPTTLPPPSPDLEAKNNLTPADSIGKLRGPTGARARFSSINVRMIPENVTFVPETPAGPTSGDQQMLTIRRGDSLDDSLRAVDVPPTQSQGLVKAFGLPAGQSPVSEGQRVRLQFYQMGGDAASRRLARVSIYSGENLLATAAVDDNGQWAAVQRGPSLAKTSAAAADDGDDDSIRLYDSLYETALKQGVPRATIDQLVRIFSNDVDFQGPATGGDSFDVLYADGEANKSDTLLYAAITSHNQAFKYYRLRSSDNSVAFYDQNGRATHKFLLREPIVGGRLTSPFGLRSHPILGYTRMHTGIDLASPIGTQIFAAGTGVVLKAGRESGYGNRIELQHANGYVTTYNHMSGFARGIAPGVHVTQGQVIGYLGMTGLATGPHVHYEVIVNGHFVDPLRVKLSQTRELDGNALSLFMQNRGRIETLLAEAHESAPPASQTGGK